MKVEKRTLKWCLALLIGILFATVNQLQVITQWLTNSPDRLFTGIDHYFGDYFLYTDQMAQRSLWTAQHFTNEPMPKTWIYWFNGLIGWLGHLAGLTPFVSYNVSLFLFVILLCLLWYFLCSQLYTRASQRFTCFLLILAASSYFDIGKFLSKGEIDPLGQFWFSPTPAFNRLGGVPHQIFQTILFVLLIIVYTKIMSSHRSISRIGPPTGGLVALVVLATTANPIQMFLFTIAMWAVVAIQVISDSRNWGTLIPGIRKIFFVPCLVSVIALISALIINQAFNLPVLTAAKVWENAQYINVSIWQFFLSVGPVGIFFAIGLVPFFKHRNPLREFIGIYGILSLVFFFSPIPKLLGTTSVRYLHPASYAVFAIIGTEGIFFITRKSHWIIGLFVYLFICLLTIPVLWNQIDGHTNPAYNTILTSDLNHVPKEVVTAFAWLKTEPDGDRPVVLMDPALPYDVLIPVLTGKITFTGHPIHTLYPETKENLRNKFFSRQMTKDESTQFFKNHRIGFVVTAPSTNTAYASLRELYKNTDVVILAPLL